jgi:hypothetical protein
MKIAINFVPEPAPMVIPVIIRQIFHGRAPLHHGRRPSLPFHRTDQPQLELRWNAQLGDGQRAGCRLEGEGQGVLVLSDFEA